MFNLKVLPDSCVRVRLLILHFSDNFAWYNQMLRLIIALFLQVVLYYFGSQFPLSSHLCPSHHIKYWSFVCLFQTFSLALPLLFKSTYLHPLIPVEMRIRRLLDNCLPTRVDLNWGNRVIWFNLGSVWEKPRHFSRVENLINNM